MVSRGHDIPGCAFFKQHNTDLSVRLCLESCTEDLMEAFGSVVKEHDTYAVYNAMGDTYFGVDLAEQVHCVLELFTGYSADTAATDEETTE